MFLTNLREPVADRDLWKRPLGAVRRHRGVRWRKVKGHQKNGGPHRAGHDRADELAVLAEKEADGDQ
jgi:ribonuclease HI